MIKKIGSGIVTLAIIGFAIYSRIPTYHQFDEGFFELGPDEYNYYEIESESDSPVKIELAESSGEKTFDAYLLTSDEYQILDAWMETDDIEQPNVNYIQQWESVSEVNHADIPMGTGVFYLVVDNSILGKDYEEDKELLVSYNLYEKY